MDKQQIENLEGYWAAKLTERRPLRRTGYDNAYASVESFFKEFKVKNLYVAAADNLGELSVIFRGIVQDGWTIDHDVTWAMSQIEKFDAFSASEKMLIHQEIETFLISKGDYTPNESAEEAKSYLELSNRIHAYRLRVIVNQYISEYRQQIKQRKRGKRDRIVGYIFQISSFIILAITAYFTYQTGTIYNKNLDITKQIFIAQDEPRISVIPEAIAESELKNSAIRFSLVNYTGFIAKHVSMDIKYLNPKRLSTWSLKWNAAHQYKTKGVQFGVWYPLGQKQAIDHIDAYGHETFETSKIETYGTHALDLQTEVCDANQNGFPVLVRATWENEKGRRFDEVEKFRLVCTMDWIGNKKGEGRSFTMIPEDTKTGVR